MKEIISSYIKKIAIDSETDYWSSKIEDDFGLDIEYIPGPEIIDGHCILREIYHILEPVPSNLIRDCGIKKLLIRTDMGPNKPYYPNHGYFVGDKVALNADIFYHPDLPDDFFDHHGYFLTRPQQTLLHEFAHGFDDYHDNLSLENAWLKLSGWSEDFKPGLKRLVINDERAPKVIGEWFYNPEVEFTRFYAKRNPWDDFADSFSFFIGNLRDKVPLNKRNYFNNLLKKYY